MAGPRSPVLLRYLDKVVGFLVPRSKVSFLVPCSGSSFRFLVPHSGSSFLVLTYRFITICWMYAIIFPGNGRSEMGLQFLATQESPCFGIGITVALLHWSEKPLLV